MANLRHVLTQYINKSTVTATIHSNQTVGQFLEDESGYKYVLVYNGFDSISTQHGCTPASGTTTGYTVTVSAISGVSPLAGIPIETIPTAQYGYIQTCGFKRVVGDSSVAVSNLMGVLLTSAGAFSGRTFVTGSTFATGATDWVCGVIVSTSTGSFHDIFFKSPIFPA